MLNGASRRFWANVVVCASGMTLVVGVIVVAFAGPALLRVRESPSERNFVGFWAIEMESGVSHSRPMARGLSLPATIAQ